MSFEVFVFIFAILAAIALIFFVIWNTLIIPLEYYSLYQVDPYDSKTQYLVISFDDLRTDYKNPIDLCNSLNPLVLPEYIIHAALCFLLLVGGFWIVLLFNVPLLAYHIHRYMNRPVMSGPGLYDPTEVMNSSELNRCQREGWIKLAYFLVSFFVYLYRLLYALLA